MFKKLYSSEKVSKLHEQEENVLTNWITHYIYDKTYGKGSGSTNEHEEHLCGNYGLICNVCNRIVEVRINENMTSTISMHSDVNNFFSPRVIYAGECPYCEISTNFSPIPLYFASAVAKFRNNHFNVEFLYDSLNKRNYLNFSYKIKNKYYKDVSNYIWSSFIYDLPLTWVFDYHSYKEYKTTEYTRVSFRIYTDSCNLAESIIDIENFSNLMKNLDYIYRRAPYCSFPPFVPPMPIWM